MSELSDAPEECGEKVGREAEFAERAEGVGGVSGRRGAEVGEPRFRAAWFEEPFDEADGGVA